MSRFEKIDIMLVDKHIRNVLFQEIGINNVYETCDYYNIKCNICGDSKQNEHLKRGYILKNDDGFTYYCHNCRKSISAIKWLKEYFHSHYKQMMIDFMSAKKSKNDNYDFTQKKGASERDEKEDTKHFKNIMKYPECVKYCEDRKIPKDVYKHWFYATGGIYHGRIIITFRNAQNKVYYYQGRALNVKNGLRYMSRFGDHNSIYNYFNIDITKPVILLEGPIDSIFVENAIAVTGLKLKDEKLKKFKKLFHLLDNDKSGMEETIKLVKEYKWCFNWCKFLKDYPCVGVKDVNNFILQNTHGIEKLTWDIIEKYFSNNIKDFVDVDIKLKKITKQK